MMIYEMLETACWLYVLVAAVILIGAVLNEWRNSGKDSNEFFAEYGKNSTTRVLWFFVLLVAALEWPLMLYTALSAKKRYI